MTQQVAHKERRHYPRVQAPIYCWPTPFSCGYLPLVDIALGGVRFYSKEKPELGARLVTEFRLPDKRSMTCTVEVVWVNAYQGGGEYDYEVGCQFLSVPANAKQKLAKIIEEQQDPLIGKV